ncbi:hypothetical protein [Arthrobacter pityocampae]|uniref:hypothetical protein n=1 Tax=Arthrobacter pityocampae TaxID=547334 RepID=UPI0037352CDC
MTDMPRRRYRVRLRRVMAGSFLAAATAASLTGVAAGPALAAPSSVIAPTGSTGSTDSTDGDARDLLSGVPAVIAEVPAATSQDRLAGVRADLDTAVLLRLVTPEQAGSFYAQIERRVAAGL